MDPEVAAGTGVLDLPQPLVVVILQLAEVAAPGALAVLNLTCCSFREALPDAFAAGSACDVFDTSDSTPGMYCGETWPAASPSAGAATQPVLRFDLAVLATTVTRTVHGHSATTARCAQVGRRFSAARTVWLALSDTPEGVLGAQLFVAHMAPHLLTVRRLFLTGLTWTAFLPFWHHPAFSALLRTLHDLSVSGERRAVATFGAQLSRSCNALSTLSLAMDACEQTAPQEMTIHVPRGLVVLHVVLCVPEPDVSVEVDTTSVMLAGSPGSLRRLKVRVWEVLPFNGYEPFRSTLLIIVVNCPESLQELDVAVSRWCMFASNHASLMWLGTVHEACPALTRLVLRSEGYNVYHHDPTLCLDDARDDGRTWADLVQSLYPLGGSLRRVELLVESAATATGLWAMTAPGLDAAARAASCEPYVETVSLAVLVAANEALPSTDVSVLLVDS